MRVKPTVAKHPTPFSPAQSHSTATPPLSPNPYDASSEDESSDADAIPDATTDISMDESFLLVRREDDEVSTSSTIGTSLRDSMIAELSDTSAGSVSGGSVVDDLPDPYESDEEPVAPSAADSLIEGSYTEADVRTIASELGDSRSTLQDSSIKLIFPDPVASITSSAGGTASDTTTPSGSLANLIRPSKLSQADTLRLNAERIERLTRGNTIRGVDESWLQASRMWGIPPEVEKMMDDLRPYQRLGSMDLAAFTSGPFGLPPITPDTMAMEGTVKQRQGEWRKVSPPPSPSPSPKRSLDRLAVAKVQRNQEARKALAQITSATLGNLGKKWGIVAIASMLSLALLGTVGPHAAFSLLKSKQTSPAATLPAMAETAKIDTVVTQLVPDLLSIKQAISAFSTSTQKAHVPAPLTTKESSFSVVEQTKRRRRTPMYSTDRAVSVRNQDVALTLRPAAIKASLSIIPRALRERKSSTEERSEEAAPNATRSIPDRLDVQPIKRISDALSLAKNYSLSAYSHMDLFYGPILASLERELGELYRLTRKLIRMSSEASGPALESASKAILRVQKSLDRASRKLYTRLSAAAPSEIDKERANQAIYRAQAGIHHLAEYVEGQASAIQEQSAVLLAAAQHKSLESLKQARRGLDRLIDMLSGEKTVRLNVEKDGPLPFDKMASGGCARCRREGRERNRRKAPPVRRSRWSRMQEAIHHLCSLYYNISNVDISYHL